MIRLNARTRALLEICSMTFAIVIAAWLFEVHLRWLPLWDWYLKTLLALVSLLAVTLPGRSLRAYGFLPQSLRFTLKWSALISVAFILPAAVSVAASLTVGVGRPARLSPPRVALTVIWCMIFIGLAEEVYFRGYVQTRLEEAFGKRWKRFVFKSWRVDYGVGLLLASAIFAAVHVVNYWNPLAGRWEPVWWAPLHILGTFAFGCLAGALREASRGIYVPASLHGSVMTAYTFLLTYTNEVVLNATLFISWFALFYAAESLFGEAGRIGAAAT